MNLGRLFRFSMVGALNTGVYYGIYLILRTQINYLLAHVCAFVVAMVCSYFLNSAITFRTTVTWRTFLLFPLSNVANFVLTTVGLRIAVGTLGVDQRLAPLPVAAIAIPITYILAHRIMLGPLHGVTRQHENDAADG